MNGGNDGTEENEGTNGCETFTTGKETKWDEYENKE